MSVCICSFAYFLGRVSAVRTAAFLRSIYTHAERWRVNAAIGSARLGRATYIGLELLDFRGGGPDVLEEDGLARALVHAQRHRVKVKVNCDGGGGGGGGVETAHGMRGGETAG